jgi:hypothetical protein
MNEHYLYRKHATGIGSWRIWSEGAVIHIAHATCVGGSEVRHKETVTTNQSGRNLDEQIKLRINSRISRMRDKGYKDTIEEAQKSSGNQLGLDRPMLAHPIEKVGRVSYAGAVLQKKLDGHRCLATRQDGDLTMYTRQGKELVTLPHIYKVLDQVIPEGVTLDGELYCHGVKLQTIGSWIKREQRDTLRIQFIVYDMISNDRYQDRHAQLSEILKDILDFPGQPVRVLPYRHYVDEDETRRWFREVRDQGFEGLMLRCDRRAYEPGKRSSGLLKIKEWQDGEFKVVGFDRSKTGWAILKCVTDQGVEFDCSAPGSVAEKMEVWENQHKYLGKKVTIDFAHWTDDNKPFQPTAIRWREDI